MFSTEVFDSLGERLLPVPDACTLLGVSRAAFDLRRSRGTLSEPSMVLTQRGTLYSVRQLVGLSLPPELVVLDRWCRRSSRRVPLRSDGAGGVSVNDPGDWGSFSVARASRVGDGLGFVLDGDGVVCVDLDGVVDGGRVDPVVASWLLGVGSFVELSPSGSGLHVWGRASLEGGRRRVLDGVSVEVYGSQRFMSVTGQRLAGFPARLGDIQGLVDFLVG